MRLVDPLLARRERLLLQHVNVFIEHLLLVGVNVVIIIRLVNLAGLKLLQFAFCQLGQLVFILYHQGTLPMRSFTGFADFFE